MKRFIDCVIPFRTCNLRCKYCYITHTKCWGHELPVFRYDADRMGQALSVKRLGGISLFNICGEGETLLPAEIVRIIYNILKNNHYVMVVTNGTIRKRFDEIARLPADCRKRLLIKFSYHYMELKRKQWFDVFFDNVQTIRDSGCSISIELTPSDELIPYIDNAIELCKKRAGAICHVTVARNERDSALSILTQYRREEYERIWDIFQSDLFKFKLKVFGIRIREYCYAGLWSGVLDLVTGDLRQCYRGELLQNIFEDIEQSIQFAPIGHRCMQPHCYNGHAFLTLGVVPSMNTPRFAGLRNRLCDNGSEWLTPEMKLFLNKKLGDENLQLTWIEKYLYDIKRLSKVSRTSHKLKSLLSRIHRINGV